MLVELRRTDKLGGRNGAAFTAVLGAVLRAADERGLDLERVRIVCDWIQYRRSFRPVVDVRAFVGASLVTELELAIDLRRTTDTDLDAALARVLSGEDAARIYLETWRPASASCIWNFNMLYWKELDRWEEVSGRGYEQALPGGESDARNAAAARDSIAELFAVWDRLAERRALSDQLNVLELGVGNGTQARVWLDEFARFDREIGRDYYRRLHYLMGDYSPHLLRLARAAVGPHADHVSTLTVDVMRPTDALAFLKYKTFFVYISNVYDNLPTDEIVRVNGQLFEVESRAYLSGAAAARIAAAYGARVDDLVDLIARLTRLGPELLAETAPQHFADGLAAVRFWRDVWDDVLLEERYVPLRPLDEYELAPHISGEILRSTIESNGDLRMQLSNGAAASFADTLPLLHPHGMLACHDLFVTRAEQYGTTFRGPGKYDGSVVNWVNGMVLASIAGRRGFDLAFEPFAHRPGSNITTMAARVRE